jgi:hypothetical protein
MQREWVEAMETGRWLGPSQHKLLRGELESAKMVLLSEDRSHKWTRGMGDHKHEPSRREKHAAPDFAISKRHDGKGGTRRWAGRNERQAAHFGTARRFDPIEENSRPGPVAFNVPSLETTRAARIGREDRRDVPGMNVFPSHHALPLVPDQETREEVATSPLRFVTVVAGPQLLQARIVTNPRREQGEGGLGGPDLCWKGRCFAVKWLTKRRPPLTADVVKEALATALHPAQVAQRKSMGLEPETPLDGKLMFQSVTDGMEGEVVLKDQGGSTYKITNPVDRRQYLPGGSPMKVELGYSPGPGVAFDVDKKLGGRRRCEGQNGVLKSETARIGWVREVEIRNEKFGWMNLDNSEEHKLYDRTTNGDGMKGPFPRYGKDWTHDPVTGQPKGGGATDGLPSPQTYRPTLAKDVSAGHGKYKRGATGMMGATHKDMMAHCVDRARRGLLPLLPLKGTAGGDLTSDESMYPTSIHALRTDPRYR